ncbi:hypothetical protein SROCM77S_05959 [Streptomyces rochei]
MSISSRPATRRQVLARSGALGAGIAFTGALSELFAGTAAAQPLGHAGYGPPGPRPRRAAGPAPGVPLPRPVPGGDQLRSGEGPVPSNHDGMSAFPGRHGRVHLVRNHENRADGRVPVPTVKGLTYDPEGKGGCTALTLDHRNHVRDERVAIAGTAVNCAGGPTPWHTWLTCEETEDKAGTNGYTKDHGFIFEVDPVDPHRTGAVPLTAMGRFQHEAIAVDPRRGVVYETEDAFERPFGLFYRFLPEKPLGGTGSLRAGGRLQAMRVPGVPDLSSIQETGASFDGVEWVDVPDPLAAETPIRFQDFGRGGITHAQKLEGCYWGGRSVYFVSSFARSARAGGRPLRADLALRPRAAPAHPGDRLRSGHRRATAGRVPGQHLPGTQRRPHGLRGRQRRPARLRRHPARRGLRDGPRRPEHRDGGGARVG